MIKVNKRVDTFADLDNKISEIYGIPPERIVALMRHETIMSNQVRTELYNIEWRKQKKIEEGSRLDHGTILYIEESDSKGKLEDYKWH